MASFGENPPLGSRLFIVSFYGGEQREEASSLLAYKGTNPFRGPHLLIS